MTPADIEIRRNYLFKPMIWKPGEPGFVGGKSGRPFIVKNHFELKNAQRVLFEGNVLENVWSGFSQHGFSILLTPKNQGNQCPLCQVTDVTIRYIEINKVGGVFEIGNGLSDAGGSSQAGQRYSIHDIEVHNVYSEQNGSSGVFAQIGSVMPPLSDVSIQHVTALVPGKILSIFSPAERKMKNFTISNNILGTSGDQQIGTKGGGPRNCAFQPKRVGPAGVVENCFDNSKFSRNLIIGWGSWPPDNIVVKDFSAAGVSKVEGLPGNHYLLCKEKDRSGACKKTSPALGSATDGKDIGANVEAIEQATRGVT